MLNVTRSQTVWFIFISVILCSIISCKNHNASEVSSSKSNTKVDVLKLGNRLASPFGDYYMDVIQPILAKRCVTCHSCTNAPCQLNMTSYAALSRGITKEDPYALSIRGSQDMRIVNNLTTAMWRQKGFASILPEGDARLSAEESIIYRNVLRGKNNFATNPNFNQNEIRRMVKAAENSEYECPVNRKEYDAFQTKYPATGMPCALPSLDPNESQILLDWIKNGAKGPSREALIIAQAPQVSNQTAGDPMQVIDAWEAFFNSDDLRSQLVSRYIFEHLFMANIQLEENPGEFYRIVRSRTAPHQPVTQIVTDDVQGDPGIQGRVYYRLQKIDRVIEAKTHVALRLALKDIKKYQGIFYQDPNWTVSSLPGYESNNPFLVFREIPAVARSRFMQLHARIILQQIARGPICFVQAASYSIDSYLLYIFLKPESDPSVMVPDLALGSYQPLYDREIGWKSALPGSTWGEGKYRKAFEEQLRKLKPRGLGIEDIWDGDGGEDPNAFVLGHRYQDNVEFDFATTHPLTGIPHSVDLMSYSGFERTYYNAAAQYHYWGTLKHKADTWDWGIYARTEAEDLWSSLFANKEYRNELRKRLTGPLGRTFYWLYHDYAQGRGALTDPTLNEEGMLMLLLKYFGPKVVGEADTLNNWPRSDLPKDIPSTIRNKDEFERGVRILTGAPRPLAGFFPNIVYVRLQGQELYSFTVSRAYIPHKIIFLEKQSRDRSHDVLQVSRGLRGIAPELFFDISYDEAAPFLSELASIDTIDKWTRFTDRHKISRSSPKFWPFVDWIHAWQAEHTPVEAGIIELKFYDRSDLPF